MTTTYYVRGFYIGDVPPTPEAGRVEVNGLWFDTAANEWKFCSSLDPLTWTSLTGKTEPHIHGQADITSLNIDLGKKAEAGHVHTA